MSRVIAIANQKGGVGKTTTAINLGASLAAAEQRTLVIDLDPQGNASSGLGLSLHHERSSLYTVLLDHAPLGRAIFRGVHLPQLDVVPTTIDLASAETELAALPDFRFRLRRALADYRDLYDFILIDCSPSLGTLMVNALAAADSLLIPLQAEYFALEGVAQFQEGIEAVRSHLNPNLAVEGILLTMYDSRLNLARQVAEEARKFLGGKVFDTHIPRNVRLAEAPSFGLPVLAYDISSAGAQAYLRLAHELMVRPRILRGQEALSA